jgi:hypothetical protein
MKYYMKFSIEEIENLLPFERDIYIGLFNEAKEKENASKKNSPGPF